MFEKLRKPSKAKRQGRIKSIFSYIVFGTICLVFVFLSPMSSQIFGEGVVAYVGSEPIRSREFRFVEANLQSEYQDRLNTGSAEEIQTLQSRIRQNALSQLVHIYLVSQASQKVGFLVSDEQLQETIRSIPVFQRKGRFVYSQYLAYLKNQRLSATRFESRVRRMEIAQGWRDMFLKSVSSNELEQIKSQERNLYKLKLSFAEVPLSRIKLDEIQTLITSKQKTKLNQFLKRKQISWNHLEEMPLVKLFDLPPLGNSYFIESLINHLPQTGLIPELFMKGDKGYVVDILLFKTSPRQVQNIDIASFALDYSKSNRLFEQWIDVQKEKFPIRQVQNNIFPTDSAQN